MRAPLYLLRRACFMSTALLLELCTGVDADDDARSENRCRQRQIFFFTRDGAAGCCIFRSLSTAPDTG